MSEDSARRWVDISMKSVARMPASASCWPRITAGIPCTIHVALGTDIVHMHPHVSGAALGEASLIDFRRLCTVVATLAGGVWLNLGSAVVLPEVFFKAVAVVRNFGHALDGLVTVNLDKESRYRTPDERALPSGFGRISN